MIPEKMLELLILMNIEQNTQFNKELNQWIIENYDDNQINQRYFTLIKEFLNPYALNKTEKSD